MPMPKAPPKLCSVEGCTTVGKVVRGWCAKHYRRWQRYGDTSQKKNLNGETLETRFWAKVDKTSSELGCWLWTGSIDRGGYGQFQSEVRLSKAHRVSYTLERGNIPKGLVIDHRLSTEGCPRHCVRPDHLRIVTYKQNAENTPNVKRACKVSSGHKGVVWVEYSNTWLPQVRHNGVVYKDVRSPQYEPHVAGYRVRILRSSLHTHNEADRK